MMEKVANGGASKGNDDDKSNSSIPANNVDIKPNT